LEPCNAGGCQPDFAGNCYHFPFTEMSLRFVVIEPTGTQHPIFMEKNHQPY